MHRLRRGVHRGLCPLSAAGGQPQRRTLHRNPPAPGGGSLILDWDCSYFELSQPISPDSLTGLYAQDLDGDGNREGVLQLGLPGGSDETYGFLVLRVWDSGNVSGYVQTYRSLTGLKSDGTFSYSSGALDHGVARLRFQGSHSELEVLAGSESDGSGHVLRYTVDGQTATAEDFEAALAEQEAKADAVWYDFTEHNLLNLLP